MFNICKEIDRKDIDRYDTSILQLNGYALTINLQKTNLAHCRSFNRSRKTVLNIGHVRIRSITLESIVLLTLFNFKYYISVILL